MSQGHQQRGFSTVPAADHAFKAKICRRHEPYLSVVPWAEDVEQGRVRTSPLNYGARHAATCRHPCRHCHHALGRRAVLQRRSGKIELNACLRTRYDEQSLVMSNSYNIVFVTPPHPLLLVQMQAGNIVLFCILASCDRSIVHT